MSTLAQDGFYYIMDYSGHYYRADAKNQLVVARDETEATVFSFVDANKRIGSGIKSKFFLTKPVEEGNIWNAEKDNEPNDEPYNESYKYSSDSIPDVMTSAAKELTAAEIQEKVEKSMSEYDLSKIDWQEYLIHFTFVVAGLGGYRDELIKAESDVDKKICDVLHYIELCDTSIEEAADLVELLKVCRENRRSIKDEVIRVDSFQRNLGTSANVAKAKEALKAIKGLETRKYVPRKFTELFEGNEMKISSSNIREFGSRKIEPKPVKEAEHYAKEKCYTEEKGYGEEEHCAEEEHMEFIRRDTAFDDKENDWMAFAMQQAEFYKNANQYIVNIRLDIEEIDDAIDDLMEEIEISNCNVTQGYKLFKRLKELRLSRKKKEKELECLYILTEHVDVNAMADECESNVNALEEYLYGKDENMASESEDIHRSSQSKDGSRKEAFAEELKGNEIAEEKFKGNGIEQEELVEKKIG